MIRPRFSLIACTLGRPEQLERLLNSLLTQDARDFEIILVDQAPPGFLDQLIARFESRLSIRHVTSERGLSRARNIGMRNARGGFLGFPDDDCWYPPGFLSRLARRLDANPNLDLILGKTVDLTGRDSAGKFKKQAGHVSKWNVWGSGNSCSMFVRRGVAIKTAGFDETLGVGSGTRFQSGEETDFILRILALGATAYYDPALKVHHEQIDTSNELDRAHAYSPGFGRVLRKHRYGLTYLSYRLARSALRALLAAAVFDGRMARYKMIWAIGTLKGYLAKASALPDTRLEPCPPMAIASSHRADVMAERKPVSPER